MDNLKRNALKYITGDLLSNRSEYTLHSCNCKGVWGSGVAKIIAEKFPKSYEEYKSQCSSKSPSELLGSIFMTSENIICLFTSDGYGSFVDNPDSIIGYTFKGFQNIASKFSGRNVSIAMPKINSGLFKTPWKDTSRAVNRILLKNPNIKVYVYEI